METDKLQANSLEELLSCLGVTQEEGFPIFNCFIGDSQFNHLLKRLNSKQNNIIETEEENRKKALAEISTFAYAKEEQRTRNLALHDKFTKLIQRGVGMDYGSRVKDQSSKTLALNSHKSLIGVNLQIADPHVHAYNFILSSLLNAERPVAIVRVDAHSDRKDNLESTTHRANYISQIVFNPLFAPKISRVLNVGGCTYRTIPFNVNNIPFVNMNYLDLPEIKEPAILDIDLDGLENGGHKCEFNICMPGGHIYGSDTFYNQTNVENHPRAVARILRTQVKNPLKIGIALERGYRNRFFWHRIERDFIEELAE